MKTKIQKTISSMILGSFLVSSVCPAPAFAQFQGEIDLMKVKEAVSKGSMKDETLLRLPNNVGTLMERFKGSSDKFIINIQDAHCNYEAQKNETRIMKEIYKSLVKDLGFIAIEGAEGPVQTDLFTSIKDEKMRRDITEYFLRKSVLKGSEFFSVNEAQPIKLYGVENASVYFDNLALYRQSYQNKKSGLEIVRKFEKVIHELMPKICSPELLELIEEEESYHRQEKSFLEHCRFLRKKALGGKLKLSKFRFLMLLFKATEFMSRVSNEGVRTETESLLKKLEGLSTTEETRESVKASLYYRLGKITSWEYYAGLRDSVVDKGMDFQGECPALATYLEFLQIQKEIDYAALIHEMDEIVESVKKSFVQTVQENQLIDAINSVRILKALVELDLTRKDYEYFRSHRDEVIGVKDVLVKMASHCGVQGSFEDLINPISVSEQFYESALQRDHVMVENTLKEMERSGSKGCILVTGGFHSDGIMRQLKEKGISYVVVTPRFTKMAKPEDYIASLFGDKSALDLLFGKAGNRLDSMAVLPNALHAALGNADVLERLGDLADKLARKYPDLERTAEILQALYAKSAQLSEQDWTEVSGRREASVEVEVDGVRYQARLEKGAEGPDVQEKNLLMEGVYIAEVKKITKETQEGDRSLGHDVLVNHSVTDEMEPYIQKLQGHYSDEIVEVVQGLLLAGEVGLSITEGKVFIDPARIGNESGQLNPEIAVRVEAIIHDALFGKKGLFQRNGFLPRALPANIKIKITTALDRLGRVQLLPHATGNVVEISPLALLDPLLIQAAVRHEIDHVLGTSDENTVVIHDRKFFESLNLDEQLRLLWLYFDKNPNGVDVHQPNEKDVYAGLMETFLKRYGLEEDQTRAVWELVKAHSKDGQILDQTIFGEGELTFSFKDHFYAHPFSALKMVNVLANRTDDTVGIVQNVVDEIERSLDGVEEAGALRAVLSEMRDIEAKSLTPEQQQKLLKAMAVRKLHEIQERLQSARRLVQALPRGQDAYNNAFDINNHLFRDKGVLPILLDVDRLNEGQRDIVSGLQRMTAQLGTGRELMIILTHPTMNADDLHRVAEGLNTELNAGEKVRVSVEANSSGEEGKGFAQYLMDRIRKEERYQMIRFEDLFLITSKENYIKTYQFMEVGMKLVGDLFSTLDKVEVVLSIAEYEVLADAIPNELKDYFVKEEDHYVFRADPVVLDDTEMLDHFIEAQRVTARHA